MTDDEILKIAEKAWQDNMHDERAYLLAFARALLADGGKGEAVGYADMCPGSGGGFTMAVFKSSDVPEGAALFTAPQAECAPQQTDAEALYEAWQNTLKHMDAQAECAPREAQPVAWFEAEESCRGMDIRSINSIIYSTRLHWQVARPQTGNPVWPLYAAPTPERADAEKDAMDLAAGASEGQADTYDVRVAFEEIARAISEHEPPDRRVAVSMRALNRWHQALAKFLYATPPGAAAEIAALRERIAGMEKDAERGTVTALQSARHAIYTAGTLDEAFNSVQKLIDAAIAKGASK